ncbi:MAG TPA: response regulator, partial [Stellaceae bacterium]|nr:response regulator [Stellaceae bacterium]
LRLPDALTIKHGPAQLLARVVIQGDRLAREAGIRLRLRTDFERLVEHNRREVAAGTMLHMPDSCDPEHAELNPENGFWLAGENDAGEIVVTHAYRIFNWLGTNLAEQIHNCWFGHYRGHECTVAAEAATTITGVVTCAAAAWVRPDFRGKHLSHLMPRIGKAYACARWPIDWAIGFINPSNIGRGLAANYGQQNVSGSVYYPPPWGEHKLVYTPVEQVYADLAKFVSERLSAGGSGALAARLSSSRHAQEVTRTSSESAHQRNTSRCGRILLTEDDEDVRELVQEALQGEGYAVDATDTVAGALSLLDKQRYDLLFTDGMLPDGTGLTIAGRAKAQKMKVVFFTGYAHALAGEELAQYPVLMKPADMDEVVRAVGHAMHA